MSLLAGTSALLLASAPAWAAPDAKPSMPTQTKAAAPEKAAEAPKAEPKKDAPAKKDKTKALTDEPELAPAQVSAEPAGSSSWLDEDAAAAPSKAAAEPAQAAEGAPASAEAPAADAPTIPTESAATSTPVAKAEPEVKNEPRIRYVIPPSTEPASEAPPEDFNSVPFTYHQLHWELSAGARVSFLRDGAYDLFSEDDTLTQASLSAGRAFYSADRLSIALAGLFETGATDASTRGMSASYASQRFALSLEARYHVLHWLHGYVRLAPAAVRTSVSLESNFGPTYETNMWGAGVDGAAGIGLKIFGTRDGRKPGVRFYGFAEGGYGYVQSQDLSLEASEDRVDRAEPVELGELNPSGAFMRLGVMLTF